MHAPADTASFGAEWYAQVPRSIRKHTIFGVSLLALTFGGFSAWGFTAPLAAAVIAQGSFVATGQNKIIQHLEGGIIDDILVSEGDHVTAGQPLVRLNPLAAQAKGRQLFLRQIRLEATVARLEAQVARIDAIQWPAALSTDTVDPELAAIRKSQELNFDTWKSKLESDIGLLSQNIESLQFRVQGYGLQRTAVEDQMALLQDELKGKQALFDQGLLRGTELKALQRAIADARGQIGQLIAQVSDNLAQVAKTKRQIDQTEQTYKESALDELQRTQGELDLIREQYREAQNILTRTTIDSPTDGTVVRLFYHTTGGVIESGKSIMEILPAGVPLIIEAQVPRFQIDNIKLHEHASIRLTGMSARTTPVLTGDVFYVSADSLPNTPSGQKDIYLARINVPPSEIARIPNFQPTPGMPAEVLIQTSERTFFQYLTKPVRDSMARAFTER